MNFFKALIPGALLAWVVSLVIGRNGASGGMLNIERVLIDGHTLHWSWPLFIVGTGLAWIIFASMD